MNLTATHTEIPYSINIQHAIKTSAFKQNEDSRNMHPKIWLYSF